MRDGFAAAFGRVWIARRGALCDVVANDSQEAGVRVFHPLRSSPTALLWAGLSLSAIGDQLYAVCIGWIGVGIFGARAGYLTSLQFPDAIAGGTSVLVSGPTIGRSGAA